MIKSYHATIIDSSRIKVNIVECSKKFPQNLSVIQIFNIKQFYILIVCRNTK